MAYHLFIGGCQNNKIWWSAEQLPFVQVAKESYDEDNEPSFKNSVGSLIYETETYTKHLFRYGRFTISIYLFGNMPDIKEIEKMLFTHKDRTKLLNR